MLLAVLLAGAAYWGIERHRYRFVHSDEDLLGLLPDVGATTFFAKVAALRAGGYLELLAGAKAGQEKEYLAFVREAGFDYSKDLDTLAAEIDADKLLAVLRGRFDWSRIDRYIAAHGGNCTADPCRMAASSGRWVSLREVQPDVMAVAIGPQSVDSRQIGRRTEETKQAGPPASDAPVWLRPSRAALTNAQHLPMAFRIFAISLQSADGLLLALEPSQANQTAFTVSLDASFENQATAETAGHQVTQSTRMLKLELERDRKALDPKDLAWLLTAGTFQVQGKHLLGAWPVRKELLAVLQ